MPKLNTPASKGCLYHDGCPPDQPRCGLCEQPRPPYLKDLALITGWIAAIVIVLTFIFALTATAADAKPHHRRHHVSHAKHYPHHVRSAQRLPALSARAESGFMGWGSGSSLVAEARSQLGNGAVYGRARLWCARFMNYVLEKTGHHGTGSDMAASFARYGRRISGPQVGAIAVMSRRGGGHVGVVSGVDGGGNPIVISGNHNRQVAETVYPRSRVYAYVMPN